MAEQTWHFLENQFLNVSAESRKRMNIILQDHHSKVSGGGGPNNVLAACLAAIVGPRGNWNTAYQDWRNASAHYQSMTLVLKNLLTVLRQSPGIGLRSKIDEWESKVSAFWGVGHEIYEYLFPQGREPFTEGGRDEIIGQVGALAQRLSTKGGQLTGEAGNPSLTPEEAADLTEQGAALTATGAKVTAFHTSMVSARGTQQQAEGSVDSLATLVETRRTEAGIALYGNLARLMLEFRANPIAVGAYFDLDTLMQSGPDEEPVPPPEGGGTPP